MKKITSIITMLLTCCSVWAGNNDIAIDILTSHIRKHIKP